MVMPLKALACTSLLQASSACMSGCFNQSSISQVSERAGVHITAVCLHWLSSTSVAGHLLWPALVASADGLSQWDFFSLSLFLCSWFALMHYCASGDMMEGRKESLFPLFCSSEHRTIIFFLEPRRRRRV